MPCRVAREKDDISRFVVQLDLGGGCEYDLGKLVGLERLPVRNTRVERVNVTMLVRVEHQRGWLRDIDGKAHRHLRTKPILVGGWFRISVVVVYLAMTFRQRHRIATQAAELRYEIKELAGIVVILGGEIVHELFLFATECKTLVRPSCPYRIGHVAAHLRQEFGGHAVLDLHPALILVGIPILQRIHSDHPHDPSVPSPQDAIIAWLEPDHLRRANKATTRPYVRSTGQSSPTSRNTAC